MSSPPFDEEPGKVILRKAAGSMVDEPVVHEVEVAV
jgi:hypothetical protein